MVDKKTGCNSKFYFINSNPNLPDHYQIPVSDMRITTSGYLIMNFNCNIFFNYEFYSENEKKNH